MYIIGLQGSPWENSVSFFPNSAMVLARPVELRKASALKVLGFLFPFARFLVFMAFTLCHCVHHTSRAHSLPQIPACHIRCQLTGLLGWTQNQLKRPARYFHLPCNTCRDPAMSSAMAKTATTSSKVRPQNGPQHPHD